MRRPEDCVTSVREHRSAIPVTYADTVAVLDPHDGVLRLYDAADPSEPGKIYGPDEWVWFTVQHTAP